MTKDASLLHAAAPPQLIAAQREHGDNVSVARQRRLTDHGALFYRSILDGAFERVYRSDGSYRLREIGSGLFLEDLESTNRCGPRLNDRRRAR